MTNIFDRRLYYFIYTHFILLHISKVDSTEYVPVFMWESSSTVPARKEVPALAALSSDEFKDILLQKIQNKPMTVVFAEENLSVEDFSWQDEAGEGSFPNLQNISESTSGLTYLPFVHAPLRVFHHHLPLHGREWHHVKLSSGGLLNDIAALNETLLFVNLDDATSNEDRPDLLKRHDLVISQIFGKLAEYHGHVLAVYTGHHSSWQLGDEGITRRVRRLLQEEGQEILLGDESNTTTTVLLYTQNMTLHENNEKSYELGTADKVYGENNDLILVYDKWSISLRFVFEETFSGYWTLSKVKVNGSKEFVLTPKGIEAPLEYSYHCSQEVVIRGKEGARLVINKLQIQPFLEEDSEKKTFGEAYDCIYFFTVPIWSGLFVCTLFSLIMAIGLCMILDIKTMDRFDDPKGKTITINVAE